MKNNQIAHQYQKLYREMGFERDMLFEAISKKYKCTYALYPGSSVHITPSFYFQHVVYVDKSEMSNTFFGEIDEVINYVNENKKYKQSPYIQFLNEDFTKELAIMTESYDLLIALFADNVIDSCKKYVRPEGLILTNDYHGEGEKILCDPSITLEAIVKRKGKFYEITDYHADTLENTIKKHKKTGNKKSLIQVNGGFEYKDNEHYLVFRKHR